jgi:hypothetical protein
MRLAIINKNKILKEEAASKIAYVDPDELQRWQYKDCLQIRLLSPKVEAQMLEIELREKRRLEMLLVNKTRQQVTEQIQEAVYRAAQQEVDDDEQDEEIEMSTECDLERHKTRDDKHWKRIKFVQTCVKSKYGTGKPIIIQFYAPLPHKGERDKYPVIQYDWRSFQSDPDLIINQQYYEYCRKQCTKVCYYV